MAILVCKTKFENRLKFVAKILANAGSIALDLALVFGLLYAIEEPSDISILVPMVFGMITFLGIVGLFYYNCHFLQIIQNKFKIFKWNNDC